MGRRTVRINFSNLWQKEGLGLTMIGASVIVIALTAYLLLSFQRTERVDQLRGQGASIARILADVPFADLRSRRQDHGPLRMLQLGQDATLFAYAMVVDQGGKVLNGVNSSGIDLDRIPVDSPLGSWSGERAFRLDTLNRDVMEFYAPVVDAEDLVGAVRIGYFVPALGFSAGQLPLIATMALIIFTLTPLFYFIVRRETRQIHVVNEEIASRINSGSFNACTVEATGDLRDFVQRFNRFSDLARSRIDQLSKVNSDLLASQKLLGYKKTRIESVLTAIPEALLILAEDGRVSFANERVRSLLDVEPADIINRVPSEWCRDEEALEFLRCFETASTSRYFADTVHLTKPSAEKKKLTIKAYPLFAPQDPDTIFGRLIVVRDVTKESLVDEGRKNFVAHVCHELKTPLNTLSLYAEALLGDQGSDDAFRTEAYNVINDEVERLASLIDNMLNISKIEMGNIKVEKQRVRLADLLRDAYTHATSSGEAKNLKLTLDVPAELSPVAVDKELLRIAINNLLTNAIKYTPAGGQICLAASETDVAIEIRVSDTGIGIGPEDKDRIFEKFYRATGAEVQKVRGHGLGLALVREIVELHHGQISVNSDHGKGSTFLISLWKDSALLKQAI